jgi:DNA-binding response OmpR family regulator
MGVANMIAPDCKILIVEDQSLIALDLQALLADYGCSNILIANNLQNACFQWMRNSYINLVLVDVELRDGSGMVLIEVLRRRHIPVIFTTGYSASRSCDVPIITKPYFSEKLMAVVLAILNGNKQ